jgi:hypothetical protein
VPGLLPAGHVYTGGALGVVRVNAHFLQMGSGKQCRRVQQDLQQWMGSVATCLEPRQGIKTDVLGMVGE